MLRSPTPDDLYRFRIPTDPQPSPDGALVAMTVQSVAPGRDGYRHAVWLVPADGSAPPRQVTLGARHDRHARFAPDGATLAFLSDRRPLVEEEPDAPKDREDGTQVHLLPLAGGEARRLTDLPRGVEGFEWAPDGSALVLRTTSFGATRTEDRKARGRPEPPKPGATPPSDYRYLDRLQNMLNGPGFIDDKVAHLWLVDVATGAARRLTDGPTSDDEPAWSPDGTRIAFSASRGRDHDLDWQYDVFVVEVATGRVTRITDGAGCVFGSPAWLPDGATLAVVGHRFPRGGGSRNDIWLFGADGSEARPGGGRNLSGRHDLMVGSGMGSDVTPGEATRLRASPDGRHLLFSAPVDGSYELWRIGIDDGAVERLTKDRHYLSGWEIASPAGRARVVAIRSSATALSDVHVLDLGGDGRVRRGARLRRITAFNDEVLADLELRQPEERWETVDGRRIQGWLIPSAAAERGEPAPLVLQIHGGPHTLYGWSPYWEFQVLAGAGISVLFTNPRGSEGYGEDFNSANLPDWGEGPMRDVMAHVDALVADRCGGPRPARGHRRLVRRLPHQLDRGPHRPLCGGAHLSQRHRPHEPDAHRGPGRRDLRDHGVRRPALGESGPLPRALAAHLRRPDPHAAADPARRERPALPDRPGGGALRDAPHAEATGPLHARSQRDARADQVGHAVPARREPGPGPILVRSLPGEGEEAPAAPPGEPRRDVEGVRSMAARIPFLRVAGDHREVGRAVGAATAPVLRDAVAFDAALPPGRSRAEQLALAARYRAATWAATPWLVAEVDGAAEAAGVDPLALFAASVEEIWSVRPSQAGTTEPVPGRCSDLVIGPPFSADGHLWVAHTNDLGEGSEREVVAVEWHVPGEPVVFSIGIGPWISVGWNDAGLSLTGNELTPNDDRVGVPRLLMVREQLTARGLDEAVAMALRPDRASSYNTVFAHRDGRVANVEGSAGAAIVRRVGEGETLAHTNHYVEPAMLRYEGDPAYAQALGRSLRAGLRAPRRGLGRRRGDRHAGGPAGLALRPRAAPRTRSVAIRVCPPSTAPSLTATPRFLPPAGRPHLATRPRPARCPARHPPPDEEFARQDGVLDDRGRHRRRGRLRPRQPVRGARAAAAQPSPEGGPRQPAPAVAPGS